MDTLFELHKAHNYIEQYAKLLDATITKENNHNFMLELRDGNKYDVIIKNQDNITWCSDYSDDNSLFIKSFGSLSAFLQRLLGNYRVASLLNIGPVFHGYHIIDNMMLIIIIEHLPHSVDDNVIRDNKDAITTWIQKIHNVGIYHGDLNNTNLRMNSRDELRMINFDTMFFRDEKDLPIVIKWINRSIIQSIDHYIMNEEQLNFQ